MINKKSDVIYPPNTWELQKEIKRLEEVIEEMHDVIKFIEEEHEEDVMDLASVIQYLERRLIYGDESISYDEANKMIGG